MSPSARLALVLLRLFCGSEKWVEVEGDFREAFEYWTRTNGGARASLRLWTEVLMFPVWRVVRRFRGVLSESRRGREVTGWAAS
jgi:hypothetical protein